MKSKTGIIWNTNKSKIVIKEELDDNVLDGNLDKFIEASLKAGL
jgi:hypothetical protein